VIAAPTTFELSSFGSIARACCVPCPLHKSCKKGTPLSALCVFQPDSESGLREGNGAIRDGGDTRNPHIEIRISKPSPRDMRGKFEPQFSGTVRAAPPSPVGGQVAAGGGADVCGEGQAMSVSTGFLISKLQCANSVCWTLL